MPQNNAIKEINNQEIKSLRRFVKSTPDKLRLVAALVRGKNAEMALSLLKNSNKSAAVPLGLAIKSALDIAKNKNSQTSDLIIKNIIVNEGPKLKRRRIVHQGRATAILKRMSHITVVLGQTKKNIEKKFLSKKSLKGANRGSQN